MLYTASEEDIVAAVVGESRKSQSLLRQIYSLDEYYTPSSSVDVPAIDLFRAYSQEEQNENLRVDVNRIRDITNPNLFDGSNSSRKTRCIAVFGCCHPWLTILACRTRVGWKWEVPCLSMPPNPSREERRSIFRILIPSGKPCVLVDVRKVRALAKPLLQGNLILPFKNFDDAYRGFITAFPAQSMVLGCLRKKNRHTRGGGLEA